MKMNKGNVENIRSQAVWSEDAKTWTLPDLATVPTRLPPAAGPKWGNRLPSQTAPGRLENDPSGFPSESDLGAKSSSAEVNVKPIVDAWRKVHITSVAWSGGSDRSDKTSDKSSPQSSPEADPPFPNPTQKLQKSDEEDFAGNYFKPKRATELLIKFKEEAGRPVNGWRETSFTKPVPGATVPPLPGGYPPPSTVPLNPLPGQTFLNSSWGAGQMTNLWTAHNGQTGGFRTSPELVRRPLKLEALPPPSKKPAPSTNARVRGLNTLDAI